MNYSIDTMKELVDKLNKYRDAYYNHNQMLITDKQYDELFDELQNMEEELGTILANSPTRTVGYTVQSKLAKVNHDHAMLSLGKTKAHEDIMKFINHKATVAMLKMDGLTVSLHYDETGNLVKAETRGNGLVGEDIFANAQQITNIPLKINNSGKPLTIDGEVIVDYDTFNNINANLPEDERYSHPRNLASGSIRQLDTKITADRNLKFVAWRVIEGGVDLVNMSLNIAQAMGFSTVPRILIDENAVINVACLIQIESKLKELAAEAKYPIDGLVFAYDDVSYGLSLGNTTHHPLHSMAFKFYDDCYETILRDIEWNTTRTGMLAPVAVFDPVDLDGAITTRATLHNVSIIKELELGIGDSIMVYRANAVIPKIDDNITRSNTYVFPTTCPDCGGKVELRKDGIAEVLYCINDDCPSKRIAKFVHFVSREGMNIDGLSEATIEKFIANGFIQDYVDLFHLNSYEKEISALEGFGKKSYTKLIASIEKAREAKLENFLNAFGIPQVGKSASRVIARTFNGSFDAFIAAVDAGFDFTQLNDFGKVANKAIYNFFAKHRDTVTETAAELQFLVEEKKEATNSFMTGKTFCITGALTRPRKEYEDLITTAGGKLSSSVSKKTDYLLTNEPESGSSKNQKAKEFGIPIISEQEFIAKLMQEA